jgi:hypothetical protein
LGSGPVVGNPDHDRLALGHGREADVTARAGMPMRVPEHVHEDPAGVAGVDLYRR